MNYPAAKPAQAVGADALTLAREIIRDEAGALEQLASRLNHSFCRAAEAILHCRGCVIVTGMGKAGLVGQKIASTMASVGTPSHFVHPAEAVHGDLGRIRAADVVLGLSFSGATDEVVNLAHALSDRNVHVIAVTGKANSPLGLVADTTIDLGPIREAGNLGLAPTTSTTAMLAIGDALSLVVSQLRGFAPADFARFHPGGSLGQKLERVDKIMRELARCRIGCEEEPARHILVRCSQPGRRAGAIMLTNHQGVLTGIFTDSDLARLFEAHREADLDQPVSRLMTRHPATVSSGSLLMDAIEIMSAKRISELPVVDAAGRPLGLIDITDVLAIWPHEEENWAAADETPDTVPFPTINT